MLQKLQAGTGLLIAGFLVLHLVNLWLAPFGAAAYDGAQSSVRGIYQWPPLEIALLAAILIHLVIGILGLKRAPKSPMTARRRLHRYSGIFLGLSIGGHILAVRGTSYVYDVWAGFSGVGFTLQWTPYAFYPYYFLLAVGGLYHGLNGVPVAVNRLVPRKDNTSPLSLSNNALRYATFCACLATALALLSFGGLFFNVGGVMQTEYALLIQDIYAQMYALVTPGRDL